MPRREALGPRKVALVEQLARKGRDGATDKDSYRIFCEIVKTVAPDDPKAPAKKKKSR